MSDPFEALLAPAKPSGTSTDPFQALLAGSNSAPTVPALPAGEVDKPARNKMLDDQVSGTADAIDLVFDLVSAPVVAATEVGTRAYHGVRNLAGASNLSRRDISVAAQKNAGKVSDTLGSPARKALQSLGFLPEGEGLVGQAMSRVMQSVEQAGKNLEANTNGAVLKEDLQMGVNMLFGALGVKGMKHVATTAAEKGTAKNALKELARITTEGDARKAAIDAKVLGALEAVRSQTSEQMSASLKASAERFSVEVNAERQAYELMQTGASQAKVEGIIKKNPAVGQALTLMMNRRAQAATFLEEAPLQPIREDGSFAPNSLIALLHRPSEMGPAEFAARDFAAGIERGPLGEPIFSANPQPRRPGRANRDPRRATTSDSGLEGVAAVEEPDVFGAAAVGGLSVADPRRTPTSGSGLMGMPPRTATDPFGAAASGGRSVADPRRTASDSGLSGQPVKRDSLGTPLSPNQVLGIVGATGLGLAALYGDDKDRGDLAAVAAGGAIMLGRGKGISLEAIRALPDTATLREIRDASSYTLNTLENLPGNRSVLAKQAIGELLRRQEVTKAERDIMQGVLDSVPGDSITAKQLMAGVKEATGDFELGRKASGQYADYGLENIDRKIADDGAWIPEDATPQEAAALEAEAQAAAAGNPEATTTIYQSPFELGSNNHFGDPNYFAHTRSFYEGGVKHVVEMQSDLAQKAGKVLTPEERAKLAEDEVYIGRLAQIAEESHATISDYRSTIDDYAEAMREHIAAFDDDVKLDVKLRVGSLINEFMQNNVNAKTNVYAVEFKKDAAEGNHDAIFDKTLKAYEDASKSRSTREGLSLVSSALESAMRREARQLDAKYAEIKSKLKESGPLERVSPMLKRWDRRLVREELAASARGRENPAYAEAQEHLASMQRGADGFMEREGRLKPDEAALYYQGVEEAKARIAQEAIPERFPPEPVVRFATADTVAKVEGWPQTTTYREGATVYDPEMLRMSRAGNVRGEDGVRRFGEFKYSGNLKVRDNAVFAELIAKDGEKFWSAGPSRIRNEAAATALGQRTGFASEHQGIYDRYQKEVTPFLRALGGKEVTDSAGHTWIEVPTEGTRKLPAGRRVQQFGAADPELVKTLGAVSGGVMVASLLSDPENKVRNAALAAVGVSLAMFGRSHVHGLGDMASAAVAGAERYLGMVSTRVGDMSPVLLRRMREHERGVLTRTNAYLQAIGPFVEGLRKVPEAVRKELDAAILTGDVGKITAALGRAGKPELVAQFRKARQLLNEVGNELMQAGKLKGLLSDYYPRIVTDVPGLLKALGQEERTHIEKQIADATRKTQREALRDLTPFETSQIINKALRSAPRGNGKPGFLQRRAVGEVTADLAKYYAPASESLPLYLRAVSKELERASFFGENLLRDPVTSAVNLDESIGNLVRQEQLAGRVNAEQAMELGDILRSRFGPGERTTARPLQSVKNLVYAGLLGHVTSAITQVGDVAISAAAHGILPTIKALQQSITRNPARATIHDLGMIDHMAEELVSASRKPVTILGRQVSTARFLEKVFKYSGFSWVDSIGKNTSIQASRNKLEGWAKTPAGLKRLEAAYGKAYSPAEMQQLTADLRSGELTDLVKGVLFSELSDVQPISKLEVPQAYLDNPNGRTLYMLKTFMLKQSDIVRRKVVQEFRTGSKRKATEQALRFGLALGIGGATTQWVNNWLLGRDQSPELTDIPLNMLKTFGMSQYLMDKVRSGRPIEAIADVVAPPYKMFDDIISQEPSAIQYLPIFGRIYYARDWFDLLDESGSEKANRKLEREQRRKEREE